MADEPIFVSGLSSQTIAGFALPNETNDPSRRPLPADFQSIALNSFADTDVWSACAEHLTEEARPAGH
jgi:hypothetical protein